MEFIGRLVLSRDTVGVSSVRCRERSRWELLFLSEIMLMVESLYARKVYVELEEMEEDGEEFKL